ncbi:MAG TPA: ferredoxin reductase family protein [Acidimicrobiia bacterium]|nr:ferredoxin reductase family protein [Acidimicrobiia bacterium]
MAIGNAGLILGWWIGHGGVGRFGTLAGDLTALGQLTALLGTFAVLLLLVLISRLPWLERRYGMDLLNHWHRLVGISAVSLITAHVVFSTVGFAVATNSGLGSQIADFVLYYPNLLAAIVGFGLIVLVAVSSARAMRRRLRYETWWLIHLYAYLGVALSFAHQITLGSDLAATPWARAYWIALFVLTAAAVLGYRWLLPIGRALRYRLRVAEVAPESEHVATITLEGRHLERLPVEAGQFFLLRFLRGDRWWKAHPFSLSAPPDGHSLRFTIKALGDDTSALQHIPPGTRVMAEGPYGAFRVSRAEQRKVALIAGGIGIAPIRALLEGLHRPPGDIAVLYRCRRREDAVLLGEVAALAEARGHPLYVSFSRGATPAPDPLRPDTLRRLIPDIAQRSVFVCGPTSMIDAARAGLRAAGVPNGQVLFERFGY